jgi:GxxExxY protein
MTDLLLEDLTFQILSAAFEVHNTLGRGFLENVYQKALLQELRFRAISAESEKRISVSYKETVVGDYNVDILVNNEVIVELKAVEFLSRSHEAQVLNYLKATGLKIGLLINFGGDRVEHKRFIF